MAINVTAIPRVTPFDATVPVTQAFADVAAVGSATSAPRRDHVHGMPADPIGVSNVVAATRTAAAGAGTQNITGAGFTPTKVTVYAVEDSSPQTAGSWGFIDDDGDELSTVLREDGLITDGTNLVQITDGTTDGLSGVGVLTADGVDITWTKTGAGQDVGMVIIFEA